MTKNARAYHLQFKPIILKQLMIECDLRQADIAREVGCARPTVNLAINRHPYIPAGFPAFKISVETMIRKSATSLRWLEQRGLEIGDVWKPLNKDTRGQMPVGHGVRVSRAMRTPGLAPGNPKYAILTKEVEMLSVKAMKQFKLFKSPFADNIDPVSDDIDPVRDIFLSEDHRYIHMAIIEAARHSGFIAVIGEVGSGKTMIRRRVVHDLGQDPNIRIIYPRIVDKTRITASSICDAIIYDLAGSDAKVKQKLEQKSRQVEDLIQARSRSSVRMVMIIEEAQDLTACPRVLKLFKRFHEIEADGKKALGIVLIGQPELGGLLNEGDHYDMREVIRRIQVAEIEGLNGSVKDYLLHKFKRINKDLREVITDGAIDALSRRLTSREGNREISTAYPLTVNNYVIRAMNWAAAHGFDKVTDEVVNNF